MFSFPKKICVCVGGDRCVYFSNSIYIVHDEIYIIHSSPGGKMPSILLSFWPYNSYPPLPSPFSPPSFLLSFSSLPFPSLPPHLAPLILFLSLLPSLFLPLFRSLRQEPVHPGKRTDRIRAHSLRALPWPWAALLKSFLPLKSGLCGLGWCPSWEEIKTRQHLNYLPPAVVWWIPTESAESTQI